MPLLGKACVLYHKKLFPGALRLYEAALRLHPHAPPAVRLGIGLCHFKLGNLDRAKAAFRRTLQVGEGRGDARCEESHNARMLIHF
jgi:RNA polymerase-associated protein CTR9